MLVISNVAVDFGRLSTERRSHYVSSDHPVFTWAVCSGRKEAYQKACRLTLRQGNETLCDSGWIEKREQQLVYAGKPLPNGEKCIFSLTVRDEQGNESSPYESYLYQAATEWMARWIGAQKDIMEQTVYLRHTFTVKKQLRTAVLYAAAAGYFKVSLDGQSLDSAYLDPAHTDYTKQCQYVMYPDLLLDTGEHCLGALLGEGFRRTQILPQLTQGRMAFGGTPVFSAMLVLRYADGERETIVTDGAWQAGWGAHAKNSLYNGETYDANQTQTGWDTVDFRGYPPAKELDAPGGEMRAMLIPPITAHRHIHPIAYWPLGQDAVVFDFGQNLAGVTRLCLPAMEKGQTVSLAHAEELDEDGDLYTLPLHCAKATDVYIARGHDEDLSWFEPIFTYHGFRYARVTGLGTALDATAIEAVELHTSVDKQSVFRCGDAQATAIHNACVQTERSNIHSIFTDCPQRDERLGWMNDATVRFEETPYTFDVGRMFPKIIRDITDTQRPNGSICCTAPFVYGFNPADPVCSSFLVAARQAYLHTGNVEVIRNGFNCFCAWEDYLLSRSKNFIVDYSYYGDWAGPAYACESGTHASAVSLVTPGEFMSTGYSYYNCQLLAEFADILDRPDTASQYRALSGHIRDAMLKKWYDPETHVMATGSHACQTFALWLGIIPEEARAAAALALRDDLAMHAYRFTTGNLCTRYLMDVLAEYGHIDDAWHLITKQSYPSFGYMLQNEATTIWERFELKKDPGMNSHSHPMYGAVDYWFYAYIAGIKPKAKGFAEVDIRPYMPEKLLSAEATVDTILGDVSVRWFKRYGGAHLMVSIPFGMTANITLGSENRRVGAGFHVMHKEDPV